MMAKRRPADFARSLLVTGTLLVRRPQCQRRPSVLHRRRLRSEETPLFATALLAACRERAQQPSPHRSGVLTGARFDLAGLRDPDIVAPVCLCHTPRRLSAGEID